MSERCEAVPAAARHSWSAHRMCASQANTTITCDLVERHVCGIHELAWEKARSRSEQYVLAARWGWLDV